GYGVFGVGGSTGGSDTILHYGGGIEFLLDGGFGIGLDFGYLQALGYTSGAAVFSAGGLYSFNRDQKTKPFVTAGYSFFLADEGSANGVFFGGGVNHLIGDNWGIKIEVRDLIANLDKSKQHFLEARFGVLLSWD
ncbi:MAG: hypothetical protein ABIJ42_05820, partial [Acidobacteriota bacterium]